MKSLAVAVACLCLLPFLSSCSGAAGSNGEKPAVKMSAGEKKKIAAAVWKNESGGSVDGLTAWNTGEDFASLGIGHFIWYPEDKKGIYEESFPAFIQYAKKKGALPPAWTSGSCPWQTRAAFMNDFNGRRLVQLRQWLAETTEIQIDYIIARSIAALPKLKAASKSPSKLEAKYRAVASSPRGVYALVDYVNFKGEGTNPAERYKGEGWGLAQVLDAMPNASPGPGAAAAFSRAAKQILSKRVANSPASRNESRWLGGWHNRCDTYARPL